MPLNLVLFLVVACPLIALALHRSSWTLLYCLGAVFALSFPVMAYVYYVQGATGQNAALLALVVAVATVVLSISCCAMYVLNKAVAGSDPAA